MKESRSCHQEVGEIAYLLQADLLMPEADRHFAALLFCDPSWTSHIALELPLLLAPVQSGPHPVHFAGFLLAQAGTCRGQELAQCDLSKCFLQGKTAFCRSVPKMIESQCLLLLASGRGAQSVNCCLN